MTFSFYQSLRTLPHDLVEATAAYRLRPGSVSSGSKCRPAMIGLVWNAMMSFGGGWFFLAASEAISVLNQNYTLPGIGSYVAAAVTAHDMPALGWAVLTMAVTILLVDQLFWRPLVAWSDKFRLEQSASAESPQSWVYDRLRRSRVQRGIRRSTQPAGDMLSRSLLVTFGTASSDAREVRRESVWPCSTAAALLWYLVAARLRSRAALFGDRRSRGEVGHVPGLGRADAGARRGPADVRDAGLDADRRRDRFQPAPGAHVAAGGDVSRRRFRPTSSSRSQRWRSFGFISRSTTAASC